MAWNEPGGGNRDPWSGSGRDQGPPDLDELFKKFGAKLSGLFGGRGPRRGGGGGAGGGAGAGGLLLIIGVALVGWLLSGFYIVDEGKRGVVLQFGRYVDTSTPGLRWRVPWPIQSHEIVDVERRRFVEVGYRSNGGRGGSVRPVPKEALMLTRDENIVDLRIAVQYQIKDPRDYLFEVIEPDLVLTQVVESTTREVIGKSTMDFVLTEGRSDIVARVEQLSQKILDLYQAGLVITNVNMQDAQPPEQVQDSFADAIKAREDEQRLKNEAEAYANEIIPKARGAGARRLEEANAYKAEVIAGAEGEAARFSALLDAYQRAPEVTRERLYLEAMERVLSINRKVLMDVPEGNNLLYLPLDSLRSATRLPSPSASPERSDTASGSAPATVGAAAQRLRDLVRERDSRRREVR